MEPGNEEEQEYLYTVLNLPTTATPQEIRDRYRSLSVIFHPDKQHDSRTRDSAVKKFYEIQKAYEVLSDPFLRTVYDTLGQRGLSTTFPQKFRNLSQEELRKILLNIDGELQDQKLRSLMNSKGRFVSAFYLAPMFQPGWVASRWYNEIPERIRESSLYMFRVSHTIEKNINGQTTVGLTGRLNESPRFGGRSPKPNPSSPEDMLTRVGGNLAASVRHRYSRHIQFHASANVLRKYGATIGAEYNDGQTVVEIDTTLTPTLYKYLLLPPTNLSLARRLYPTSSLRGEINLGFSPRSIPTVRVGLSQPFILHPNDRIATSWAIGPNFQTTSEGPGLTAEWAILLRDLALRLKVGIDLSLEGLSSRFTGIWESKDERTQVMSNVEWSSSGVAMTVSVTYLEQTFAIPLILSTESNPSIAIFAAVLPSTAFILANHFILAPRRAATRARRRRAVQSQNDEAVSKKKREAADTSLLLGDIAKRIAKHEEACDGLIIIQAEYVPLDEDDKAIQSLAVDVTIAVQALVHNSQLFIPGNRSMSYIPGFYDPLPEYSKKITIRYTFKGRSHYAEIPDRLPVVLPLRDHVVDIKLY